MPFRYMPVLRTKAAEVPALSNLSNAAKSKTFPIFRMTPTIPQSVPSKMIAELQEFQLSVDGGHNFDLTGSARQFVAFFNALGNGGLSVIPAVSTNDDPNYISAAIQLKGAFGIGIVVIVTLADLPAVARWCQNNNLAPNEVDLVVTAGDAAGYEHVSFATYVTHAITATLSDANSWRSTTLHSFSAARDHSGYSRGRSLVPRKCWMLWDYVNRQNLPFRLDFSDCGHIHASLDEAPGFAMANATVSVRYTINNCWVVLKGTTIRGPSGSPMTTQYRAHATALIREPEFNQIVGCWGDARIQHYATTRDGTGSRAKWVEILLNRHISHVCDRLP